jgi:hypothetical protein
VRGGDVAFFECVGALIVALLVHDGMKSLIGFRKRRDEEQDL